MSSQFLAGNGGRLLRIVAGVALIGIGLRAVGGTAGFAGSDIRACARR